MIKDLILLQEKSRERKKRQLFCIEGQREIQLAIQAKYSIKQLFFCDAIIDINQFLKAQSIEQSVEVIGVSIDVYQKIAHRKSTEGVIAVAAFKNNTLADLELPKHPLILVAEAPEKPGNLGALLRTADAANLDAVIIANPKTDLYNPNIVRSSVGCLFTNQIAMGSTEDVIDFLKSKGIAIHAAVLSDQSKVYLEQDFTNGSAIVVGTEATGLSDEWIANADHNIIIPMEGEIDSLNVSVSAAILIFEAKRQRALL